MAKCYRDGILQTVASKINSEDFSVTLTYEFLDWPTLQLLYGELAQSGGAAVPTAKTEDLVGTTIVDSEIIAANEASVLVYNATEEVFMTLAAASPGANEYSVDGATNTITFNAAQTGQTINYKFDKIYSSIESIGSGLVGDQYDELSNLSLTAVLSSTVYPSGIVLVAEQLERTNTPTLAIEGDRATVSITYRLIAGKGRRKPFRMFKLEGATV